MSLLRATSITTRQAARQTYAVRALSTSVPRGKTVTESVKDTADSINKKIGKTLASGIDTVEKTTESVKETVASTSKKGAKETAETAESARQNTNQALGTAAGKARDAKDDVEKKL